MRARGPTAILMLSCADQKGLVATVADLVYRAGGNIVESDQHTDAVTGAFLQRIEWEMDGFTLGRDQFGAAFDPVARRFGMTWDLRFSDHVARVAVFVSRLEHCLYDLLGRWRAGELQARIPLVISNHEELRPVAEAAGVPFHVFPVDAVNRADQEARMHVLLQEQRVEMLVLARYMRVLSPEMVALWPNRIVNIHHSFLPAFAGARPYHQAHERGVKVIGATAHYVTSALDEGPIIAQDVTSISHRDSVDDLVRKGRDLERVVLARAVGLHLRHRVLTYGNRTVVFD